MYFSSVVAGILYLVHYVLNKNKQLIGCCGLMKWENEEKGSLEFETPKIALILPFFTIAVHSVLINVINALDWK